MKGRGRVRFVLTISAVAAEVIGTAAVIPVDNVRTVGFITDGDRAVLVAPAGTTELDPLIDGVPVDLTMTGVLVDAPLAYGVARAEPPQRRAVALTAFSPVDVPGLEVDAQSVGVVVLPPNAALPPVGRAVLHLGSRSLLDAAWTSHVAEPAALLLSLLDPPTPDQKEGR